MSAENFGYKIFIFIFVAYFNSICFYAGDYTTK